MEVVVIILAGNKFPLPLGFAPPLLHKIIATQELLVVKILFLRSVGQKPFVET